MRSTFAANFAILASSLLVKEVLAAPVQERALYIDTDIVMVTEEVTVNELPDGSYATGAPVALGTSTINGTPVLFTESSSIIATPIASSTSSVVAPATTSSATSVSAASVVSVASVVSEASASSETAVFIQAPHTSSSSSIETPVVVSTSLAPVVTPTTFSTIAISTPEPSTSTTSSVAASTSTTTVSSSKKRGLAYNDASALSGFVFSTSQVSWAYNWASTTSAIASGLEYIPMLWGLSSGDVSQWSSIASAAIASGSTALLGFNEPDYSGQANLGYAEAATGWTTYMEPFAGKATLVSPAVTNGGSPMGLTWLSNFMTACSSCTIDAVAIHWYNGGDAAAFKDYVQQAYTAGGNRPLWITEFQASGTSDEQNSFLEEVIPFLDSSDMVAKYAYFMASDGILLSSGSTLSALGNTFASYVS